MRGVLDVRGRAGERRARAVARPALAVVVTAVVALGAVPARAQAPSGATPTTVLLTGGVGEARAVDPVSGLAVQLDHETGFGYEPAGWHGRERVRLDGYLHDLDGGRADEPRCPPGSFGPGLQLDEGAWSPDRARVATITSGRPRDLAVRDCSTGTEVRLAGDGGGAEPTALWTAPSWTTDGDRLFVLDAVSADVVVFDPATGERVTQFASGMSPPSVRGMAVSPDGRRVAFATVDEQPSDGRELVATGRLWVLEPGGRPRVVDSGPNAFSRTHVAAPAWDPSGGRVAWWWFGVRAVDVASGRTWPDATLPYDWRRDGLSDSDVVRAAWSHDGAWLLVGGQADDSGCHCPVGTRSASRPFVDARPGEGRYGHPFVAFAPGVVRRSSGLDRARTAVAVSRRSTTRATDVVLARQDDVPDALAGGPLAAVLDAPLLLTATEALDPAVAAEIRRLAPERVHVLGSTAAISSAVDRAVEALGAQPVRHFGPDRWGTATQAADAILDHASPDRVFLAKGADPVRPDRAWPDALAASALAGIERAPLLLTPGDELAVATRDYLRAHADWIDEVVVVGGSDALSDAVADEAARVAGASLTRLEGEDRYATSVAAARRALDHGADPQVGWLAIGSNWPDALAAAPAAARAGGWLALTPPDVLPPDAPVWSLVEGLDRTSRLDVAGGADVLRPAVTTAIEARVAPFPGLD